MYLLHFGHLVVPAMLSVSAWWVFVVSWFVWVWVFCVIEFSGWVVVWSGCAFVVPMVWSSWFVVCISVSLRWNWASCAVAMATAMRVSVSVASWFSLPSFVYVVMLVRKVASAVSILVFCFFVASSIGSSVSARSWGSVVNRVFLGFSFSCAR